MTTFTLPEKTNYPGLSFIEGLEKREEKLLPKLAKWRKYNNKINSFYIRKLND